MSIAIVKENMVWRLESMYKKGKLTIDYMTLLIITLVVLSFIFFFYGDIAAKSKDIMIGMFT